METIYNRKFVILLIALAVVVGLLHVAPSVLVAKKLSSLGQPFVLLQLANHSDEVHGYVPRARDVYEGKFPPEPRLFPWLTSFFLSIFIFLAGGNINLAYLSAVFFFSALIFISFFFLIQAFLKDKKWSLFLGLVGSLTPIAIYLPYAFGSFQNFGNIVLKNFYPLTQTPLVRLFMARVDNPLLTLFVYLGAIIAVYAFWNKPNLKTGIIAGALNGLLFYVYFHYGAFLVVINGLLSLYALAKVKEDKQRLNFYLIFWAALLVVLVPYLVSYLSLQSLASPDFFQRLGMEIGHSLRFSRIFEYLFYAGLALIVYFTFWRKEKTKALFFYAAIISMFLVWNLQVITGFQPELKWDRAIAIFIFVILANVVYEITRSLNRRKIAAVLFLLGALLLFKKVTNVAVFINPPQEFLTEHTFDADIANSWKWIENNVPKGSVMLSPSYDTSHHLAVYTSATPFLRPGLSVTDSNLALEKNFLIAKKLFGISRDVMPPDSLYYNYYKNQSFDVDYRNNFDPSLKVWKIPEDKKLELERAFDRLPVSWSDVEADYVYFGPWEKQISGVDLRRVKELKLVYKNGAVEIYAKNL